MIPQKIDCFDGEYAFLSNFYPSQVEEDGGYHIVYPTIEHYFQAMKTKDEALRRKIAAAETPGKAKRLGRKLSLRADWEQIKDQVMYYAIKGKFEYPELREKLLATGDAVLEEGNTWHDNYWGNCHCEQCKDIAGKNTLGRILMLVRKEIRDEEITN